jgi:hypothetical protein
MLHAVADSEFEPLVEVFAQSNGKRSFEAWMIHILDGCIDYALAHPRIFDYVFSMPHKLARRFPEDFRARRSPRQNMLADMMSLPMKLGKLKRDDAGGDRHGTVGSGSRLSRILEGRPLSLAG